MGLDAHLYHKKVLPIDRRAALRKMQASPSGVLVSTDAAARGLDLEGVRHIVQADFAENAVDFLHRIGRTARGSRCAPSSFLCSFVFDCVAANAVDCLHLMGRTARGSRCAPLSKK